MLDQKKRIVDDIYPVDVSYSHPPLNHIACAFDFAQKDASTNRERTLRLQDFFEDFTDPSKIYEFEWPKPAEHMDFEVFKHLLFYLQSF